MISNSKDGSCLSLGAHFAHHCHCVKELAPSLIGLWSSTFIHYNIQSTARTLNMCTDTKFMHPLIVISDMTCTFFVGWGVGEDDDDPRCCATSCNT